MPNIYDNIEAKILDGLTAAFTADQTQRADICVGYINLRGWRCIADAIDRLPGDDGKPPCRLIVGMPTDTMESLHRYYTQQEEDASNEVVVARRNEYKKQLAKQLSIGTKSNEDQTGLLAFAAQLKSGKVQVKFFARHRLHAKLYLAHRTDKMAQVIGFVGSSNLTFAGIRKQGELNVDVVEQDAAQKLAKWFDDRWGDRFCFDITQELIDIIEDSWAIGPITPYEIYIKTAYELSNEARVGEQNFAMPDDFNNILLEHQTQAVSIAAERLHTQGGILIGDVVGLGKTLVACAIAKILDDDLKYNTLVICPARLVDMWKFHLKKYRIIGSAISLDSVDDWKEDKPLDERYQLVIIDESHNLRNREGLRYKKVRAYLQHHESRTMLLTATPYNKHFDDIASQLNLFVPSEADLGIRPDAYIKAVGGSDNFRARYNNILPSSLAAFGKSEMVDDWRELIGMYMIRRTRTHIIENYAKYDQDGKPYLRFANGEKFYFPKRVQKPAIFDWKTDKRDQYALLYSEHVVDRINSLHLPRYGTVFYLEDKYTHKPFPQGTSPAQQEALANLTRAGNRLIGFARANLFKRLESCGPAFLKSVRRHIARNAVFLAAIEQNAELPIGDVFQAVDNERNEKEQDDLLDGLSPQTGTLDEFKKLGEGIYELCKSKSANRKKFKWLPVSFFDSKTLKTELEEDCEALMQVLQKVPQWNPHADRKLEALVKLCAETHANEKVLIFTQYVDTAYYLYDQFCARGITDVERVFGGSDNVTDCVNRFSPGSNYGTREDPNQIRVLITTDTLSEGQNLQDAHVIVNFDLPWTIIRLVQRAGRVDRIGQQAPEVICYSFLPEDGIEDIIFLRDKLQARIKQNAQVVGSEERFFEGNEVNLDDLYSGQTNLYEQDEETDLVSLAYNVWQKAVKDNDALKTRIETMPDGHFSGKYADDNGAIAYIKTAHKQSVLMQLDESFDIVSQSQFKLFGKLKCAPGDEIVQPLANHHKITNEAQLHVLRGRTLLGGVLGGANNVSRRVYDALNNYRQSINPASLLNQSDGDSDESQKAYALLEKVLAFIHAYPLTDDAKRQIRRQLNAQIRGKELADMVTTLYKDKKLCNTPKSNEPLEPRLVCSMGLIENKSNK